MIDSRAQSALIFLWCRDIAVNVNPRSSGTWRCELAVEDLYGHTVWTVYEAASRDLAIEKAATAHGWSV